MFGLEVVALYFVFMGTFIFIHDTYNNHINDKEEKHYNGSNTKLETGNVRDNKRIDNFGLSSWIRQ